MLGLWIKHLLQIVCVVARESPSSLDRPPRVPFRRRRNTGSSLLRRLHRQNRFGYRRLRTASLPSQLKTDFMEKPFPCQEKCLSTLQERERILENPLPRTIFSTDLNWDSEAHGVFHFEPPPACKPLFGNSECLNSIKHIESLDNQGSPDRILAAPYPYFWGFINPSQKKGSS